MCVCMAYLTEGSAPAQSSRDATSTCPRAQAPATCHTAPMVRYQTRMHSTILMRKGCACHLIMRGATAPVIPARFWKIWNNIHDAWCAADTSPHL